jgi:hypothetical protein
MIFHRRALAGAFAAILLVAACGGGATTAPTNGPGASAPVETEAPTQAPAETPTETPQAAATSEPSLVPGAAGDLEALLPSEVSGVAFEKSSFDGQTVPGGIPLGQGDDDFAKFLAENGKSLSDIKIAVATPADQAAGAGTLVMAIQVAGVPSDKLVEFATGGSSDVEKTTVGGKQVWGGGMEGFGAYFYAKDDVIFYVLSVGGADLSEGILAALP